ncbi:hypothetical protein RchiOBHm_Chr3g0450631 [Rosa chinensis]|uniref:Uncharacterized protein n=1 Tax=Rosa chinensis TaxID=74649 RepID=A0A2P6R5T9_ROSCH|nr:hypothetical protein RchiOBHm_Chr3g0450631 [Rosa chinensis]
MSCSDDIVLFALGLLIYDYAVVSNQFKIILLFIFLLFSLFFFFLSFFPFKFGSVLTIQGDEELVLELVAPLLYEIS